MPMPFEIRDEMREYQSDAHFTRADERVRYRATEIGHGHDDGNEPIRNIG